LKNLKKKKICGHLIKIRLASPLGEGIGSWFEGNICRVVGEGMDTLFWYDIWVGDIPLRHKFPRIFDLSVNKE